MNLSNSVARMVIIISFLSGPNAAGADESRAPVADPREPTMYRIPNLAENGEAYYAPDGIRLIAQVKDPDAQDPGRGKVGGALTYTFTDTGKDIRRINDHGMDACSWFYPDTDRLLWTSTRDHVDDMPAGDRSNHGD